MKELVGKNVFLRGAGNFARRNSDNIFTAKIIKVGRVFVKFIIDGSKLEHKYRVYGNYLDSGCNAGYYVFAEKQELEDMLFVERASRKIIGEFNYLGDYTKLSRETITKVAELLKVEL